MIDLRRTAVTIAATLILSGCDANQLLGGPRRAACADTIVIRLDTLDRVDTLRVRCR